MKKITSILLIIAVAAIGFFERPVKQQGGFSFEQLIASADDDPEDEYPPPPPPGMPPPPQDTIPSGIKPIIIFSYY